MKIKLEYPTLIQSENDLMFMIAEYIEVDQEFPCHQISYYGKCYTYDDYESKFCCDGQWIYDLKLNTTFDVNDID